VFGLDTYTAGIRKFNNPWGYLLASVSLFNGITLGLGVSMMEINVMLHGVADSIAIMMPFLFITGVNIIMSVILLKNVKK